MELECDLSKINNEELLRKMLNSTSSFQSRMMTISGDSADASVNKGEYKISETCVTGWQQSENDSRKKEIRSQLYKLRESRLRDLYQGEIMADNSLAGFGKDPLATSHGDALADQSFQSLKSKEIRDSLSPTEMKFQSMALNNPNTTGWNVQTSKEISPDGRGFRAETLATTDGVENINGGTAEFKGRNEQRSSAHHQGDDKNFIKKAMESSNSHLQEKVVVGDENSGRTEVRTSSSTSTSSSQVVQSSTNVEYDDGKPIQASHPQKYLTDSNRLHHQDLQQRQQQEEQRLLEEQRLYEQQFQQQRQHHVNQQERRTTEQLSTTRQNMEKKNISQNIQTQETHEQNKHYVDMDKASPEYQQHVQYLMQQAGEIISNTVEYPKPNVKMITTVKRLPDGTIVRNKRYETEELTPTTPTTRSTSNAPNQTQPRHDSQHPPTRNYQPDSAPHSKPSQDMVDSSSRYIQDSHIEDAETKFSSVKKSSSKFSSETTSETIQEFDDHQPSSRPKPVTNDFSTHGFPSVRSNKPTQEHPTESPHLAHPTQGYPSHSTPSRPMEDVVPKYIDDTDNISERRINTKDGEVIIVSSEKKRNYKTSTNSERIVEAEHVIRDDQPYQQIPDQTTHNFTTHGFPSVREPTSSQPSKNYPSDRQMQPNEQDFPLDKFSPGTRIIKNKNSPHGDDDVVVVSSTQRSRTAKHSTNTERVIEHEIVRDDQTGSYPRSQPNKDNSSPYNYTVTTPGDQTPQGEFPGSPKKPANAQGFPSVRTPGHSTPGHHVDFSAGNDYPSQGYVPSRPAAGLPSSHNQHPSNSRKSPSQDYSSQGFPSVRSPTKGTSPQGYPSNVNGSSKPSTNSQPRTPSPNKYKTPNSTVRETTERVIRKEKEVDSAHRAFAASLRSSSPIDHVRRDSYTTDSHTRHTPRSSVSSTKTFRRDMREGSHDSAPSETSRVSTSTITRNTPPRNVGGRNVVTKVATTRTGPGSNDTLNVTSPRGTKSPSPGKTVTTTTTTTTRTLTSKDAPKVTDNQHTRITTNNIDTIFPINEPPLTSITKNKFSDNYKQPHKKPKNISKEIMPVANTFGQVEEAIEAPCLRKNYYKLGPSDQPQTLTNTTTFHTLKSPQIFEKSPIKKQSSQPAPSSRSSTPSYNSRKPPTSMMADDYDDVNQLRTTSPFSPPSSRSRTPQKFAPNDKPQDDWQKPRQPDDDERRTVNRETTFEKNLIEPTQPSRKPNFDQPNVEWVIVDDVDDYEHSDDSFAPEVVDSNVSVRKTTTTLITQEKQTPLAPQRRSKPSTTTTVTTKQFQIIPNNTPAKTNDKSPLKTKPNDTRTPQTNKRQKPLIDSRSSVQTALKLQPKNVDNKPVTKGPKSTVPSYASPLKKPLPKNTTEETALRKTLKTSQVLKEKTTKLIEVEKNKTRPQKNYGKTKPQTPGKRKPSAVVEEQNIVLTEIINEPRDKTSFETDDELIIDRPSHKEPFDTDDKPNQKIPGYKKPQETNNEPYQGSPRFSTDDIPHTDTPGYRKSPSINDEPNQFMPSYRKPEETPQGPLNYKYPIDSDNEPQKGSPELQKDLYPDHESNQQFPSSKKPLSSEHPRQSPVSRKPLSPGFKKLQGTFDERSPHYGKPYDFDEPNQGSPVFRKPLDNNNEPHYGSPSNEKPEDTDDNLVNYRPGRQNPQQIVTEQIQITETSLKTENELEPSSDTPCYRKPQNAKEPYQGLPDHNKPQNHYTSDYRKQPHNVEEEPGFNQPQGTDDEPSQASPAYKMPKQTYEQEVTITETSRKRFTEKETPIRRPQDSDSKPTQHTPESKKPNQGKPRTLDHRKPSQPLETEDDESFTESNILNTQKTVAKHIQKFETNYFQNHSPKPQKRTKSPTKEPLQTQKKLPKTPVKETSPTRTQIKPQPVPAGKPKENKTIPEKPLKTNDCEIVVKTTEIFINQNKPDQKFPEKRSDTVSKTTRPVSPTQTPTMPVDNESLTVTLSTRQVITKEMLDKEYPKKTEPFKKSVRPESEHKDRKPLDTDEDETVEVTSEYITQKRYVNEKQVVELEEIQYPDKKPSYKDSPNREISPIRPTVKVAHSPYKHVSPTRSQKKHEQVTPTEPSDKRPKSPNKSVSPTRAQKKPVDNESFITTLKTTNVARDKKVTKEFDNAKYTEHEPKGQKPVEPLDVENNKILIETNEFIKNSITKRVESEQQIIEFEEPSYPVEEKPKENIKSSIRKISPTRTPKKPGQKLPEKPTERLSQSPSKAVSPTRTQKKPVENSPEKPIEKRPKSPIKHISPTRTQKKPDHSLPVDDRTLRETLRSTETVKEKTIRKNGEMDYPEEPEAKPKRRAPNAGQTSDTEEDDTITGTSEFVINSKQQFLKTTKHIQEIEEKPHHPNSQNISKSPFRGVSPIRSYSKPSKPTSEDKFEEPTTKYVLVGKKPLDEDESFTTLVTTTKIVKERVTQEEDDAEYPHTRPKGRTPQNKPLNSDEYETFVETTEKLVTKDKQIQELEENSYPHKKTPQHLPVREVSPTGSQKKPDQLSPQNTKCKEPSYKRPQSPKKHVSPTRIQKHPDDKDDIFKTSLRTTKTVTKKWEEEEYPEKRKPFEKEPKEEKPGKQPQSPTRTSKKPVDDDESFTPTSVITRKKIIEKITKKVDDAEYFDKGETPEIKPKGPKPSSNTPSDNEEDEIVTETSGRYISSKTCKVKANLIQEREFPINDNSPTRKPAETAEEPSASFPTKKRPQSPTKIVAEKLVRKPKSPTRVISPTRGISPQEPKSPTRVISPTRGISPQEPDRKQPTEKGPQSPKRNQQKPTDKDETFKTTLRTIKTVTEKRIQEPESPTRGVSPTRAISPIKDNQTFTTVTEKATLIFGEKPKELEPNLYKPTEIDGDETITETTKFVIKTVPKPMHPGSQEPNKEFSTQQYPAEKSKYIKPGFVESDDDETITHTSEFIRNTSQKLITTEQQAIENTRKISPARSPSPKGLTTPKGGPKTGHVASIPLQSPKMVDRKLSPNRSPSPKDLKSVPKAVIVDDKTSKKLLSTTEIIQLEDKKIKPKDHKADLEKPVDTDEEETTTEDHETLSTILIKHKTQKLNKETKEPLNKPRTTESAEEPEVKPFTSTFVETIETIENQTYPEETEQFPVERKYSDNKTPLKAPQEPWSTQQVPTYTTDINEQFIETERVRKETPDGAFISKTTEPSAPTSPTFKKKGTGRSDTFEERCRQILGMDTYGNTPGSYKKQPSTEIEEITKVIPQDVQKKPQEDFKNTTVFQVKIEDCDEENEALSINSVKKNLHKQIPITKERRSDVKEKESKPRKPKEESKKPETKRTKEILEPEDDGSKYVQKITETTTVHTNEPHIKYVDEIEPDSSETEMVKEFVKTTKKSEVKVTKKYSPTSSPRSSSPTKTSSSPQSVSPSKGATQRNVSPTTETQKRKPTKTSPQKLIEETTNIKDRLRSSTRKTTSPSKLDQVDGSESSPEHSPTRYTERRRSSNISVTTEIIIEHTDSDTPSKKEKSPPITRKPKDSVFKEIIDSTVLPEKLTRRMLVTERKESAPVHRVTNRDKDSKMSRSTSENLIKVKKPEPQSLSPKGPTKTTDHRRPNKCFATKSINLSATDRLVNSEDMENVVIDIQHAKSSREPSPDKIVPTPVPAHLDTGKPRYPDVVQEPEDDHPRKKPQIKNIPIFEEEHNSYVGCHITEVNMERTHKTTYDSLDYEEQILNNPVVEAPASLDYPSLDKPSDDESVLTVHEKVSKFQNLTEEKNGPKTLQPLKKEYKVPQDDECLLNISEKVDTVVKNTKSPKNEVDEDEEFERNERIYTTVKLAPTAPQKSPELVRTISRHISRQSEPDHYNDDLVECLANKKKTTKEFKVSHHSTTESTEKTTEKYQQPKEYVDDDDHDDDELIPHTATHTNIIEERRQKDILSRPSVFDSRNKKCNKSPVKDSEKLRPDNKSRTKPTSAVTNTPTEQATANKPKQSLQRKNSDIDYELRGSNVETGVSNIISKQTKVFNNKTSSGSSSSNKTNDLKKTTTTSNNKNPEKHMPVRLTPANKSDELDLSADDEMIVSVEETTNIDIESQVVNEHLNKETSRKIPLTATTISHKKQPTSHSSTNSSPTDQPLKTKKHVVELTDKNPLKSNTVTTTSCIKTYEETVERADDIDETVLEPTTKKSTTPHPHTKAPKMSTTTTDSVAAKRSLFESNNSSRSTTPTKRTPLTSPMSGRRPSYMDHTKSSLEHTRRDSLEINKTNYSRKPSHPEEEVTGIDRNSMVKFDVPHGKRPTTARAASVTEDINVEEIFELEVLEKLLETVQSYEIRRRIRAQIRLIKKNQRNEMISSSTDVITRTVKTSKVGSEEPDNITSSRGRPNPEIETEASTPSTRPKEATNRISSNKKEYIFDEAYHPTTRRSPKPNRYPYEEEKQPVKKPTRSQSPASPVCKRNERHHSPDQHQYHTEMVREQSSRTTKQQHYTYEDEQELEELREIRHETSPTRKSSSPNSKPNSLHSSPERRQASPDAAYPTKTNERSRSPQTKRPQSTRVTSSRSPDSKTTATSVRKSSATYEQQETVKSSTTKPQIKRITTTTVTTSKSRPEDKTPVWADRKNILKTPQKPSSSTPDSRSGYNRTIKSTTSQKMTSNKSSFAEDDCVTSSYGIGPTDENGLPLFGIRALKKKKPTMEPSETTEEVTGYVVEEKYYSDNKTKPTVERKEFIYSTNPEELQKLKEQVEVTSNKKALKDVEVKETRQATLISKATPTSGISPEDDYLDSTTKYVRRGSVKEMSEKFIQREASSTVTEKSNNYPKAGLILRTNSRKNSRDADNENDFDSYKTRRVQQHHTSTVLADSDDNEHEYEVEEVASRHSGRFITESESECDSIKTQREFKKVTTSSSSSMATRSFLNSQGEEKVITNVSDCLERMRNADNVVEEGDTAEDQEARALLNKFLGASIIMKGAESSLPAANRQSKIISTTMTSSNLSDDNDGDNNAKHEVKTTRITKTIKSGSSSTPVTYTTCDIEEIWDEEILKELLEQARTYEERRKIRSRLRELMADREETKKGPAKGKEKEAPTAAVAANDSEEEESSASEYEEIIEEVTDYSEAESELDDKKKNNKVVVSENSQAKENISEAVVTKTEEKSVTVIAKSEVTSTQPETHTEQAEETTTVKKTETETVEEVVDDDKVDSSEKGESLKLLVHDKTPQPMPQEDLMHSNQSTNSKKLQTAQINSNSKETVSEGSSMQVPHNNNKTQKAVFTGPTFSRNPTVTVQTTGRADSASISNKNNNKNINSSRPTNSNANVYSNNDSSSGSLGGSSVVVGSGSNSPRQVDRLGVPQKEDSGTESGEDLRLIAAGLRDQLQIQSDSNIIEDVTCALSRLESSLKEGKDISVDTEKRKALLALVARLRAGLTSPEKLAEIAAAMSELDGNEGLYGETSSPEADAHRSNRSRFGKRKNRNNRHTVGVSREELADARRYMEDMLLLGNISQSTTPEANSVSTNTLPQWYPLEKNASSAAILTQSSTPVLRRPKQFVPEENANTNLTYTNRLAVSNGKRRPLSGEYSVTFENPSVQPTEPHQTIKQTSPPDDSSKFSRFTNKKHLMKRANTIDLSKTHKYNSEFDTDSDAEDKGPHLGLKRAVQVSVKKRVQNVVPPFEPKTENDRKFLAFINKQSDKPGLGWTSTRSVSNWSNKFGSIKNTFEGGLVGKPPQVPHHASTTTKAHQTSKQFSQPMINNSGPVPPPNYITNQQIAMRLQQEAERQAEERGRKLERERLEYERRERDKLERQRQQRERQERERLEREHFERQRREQDQIAAAQHAAILREQEQFVAAKQVSNNANVPKPILINEFKHAPQSVFRPIDNVDSPSKPIYKPIPQLPRNSSNWQSLNAASAKAQANNSTATSPSQYGNTRPDNSFITSPPPSSRSPIVLPWASKPTVDSSDFKSKAHRFEERSKYDNINNAGPYIQRHNSLRSSNGTSNPISDDFRKRPSLPNTREPYSVRQMPSQQDPLAYLPPPQNISFTYSNLRPKNTYQSYPCLPSAVISNSSENNYQRSREDSLTDPHSVPLVLTSSNPSYCPPTRDSPQQQQQLSQPRLPRQFDLVSPADSMPTSPSIYNMPQTDCTDDDLDSDYNLLEYHAVSRVMRKPQCQTAVTVGRRTGHVSDDELYGKNSRAAKTLLSTMKSLGNSNGIAKTKAPVSKRSETVTSPKTCLSPDGRSYQAPIVEPLFPEINKFEANRKPLYMDNDSKQAAAPSQPQSAPRKQMGMYKSMEHLNRTTVKNLTNFNQQPSPKPYVTETQTSYVVTFPVDDTTDDEDLSRLGQKRVVPPNSLSLHRQRNVSENSTGSSTTASISYSQNLPSPNTSWTSNPIVGEESNTFPNKPTSYQNTNNVLTPATAEPTYQTVSSQVAKNYSTVNQNYNTPNDSIKKAAQYEAQPQKQVPQQQPTIPYNAPATQPPPKLTQTTSISTSKSSYEAKSQRQLQQQQPQYQNTTNQKQMPQQVLEKQQKPSIIQKTTDNQKQISKTATKTSTTTSITQEKRSLATIRKAISEDYPNKQGEDPTKINPQHSNISQEMLIRLEQQRERISNETRRKSLGNTLDYQMEKQARFETQQSQEHKSSAPSNTPDIVKSSLPKDESQPILKKFGPPQRHHYMPNSYQSPTANTTSSSVVATSTHSTKIQGKQIHSTSNHTVVKSSQQILNNTRPTVMETPATPQPDDDYIPRNIVFNNIHAFTSMTRRQDDEVSSLNREQHPAIRPNKLSKSDSWNQIMMLQNKQQPTPTTKFNQSPTNELRRTKSGHTLALPKMYEAAMTKTDICEKQKTVAAYFTGQKSPTQQETVVEQQITKRSVINRTKTSEKVSAASRKSLGSNLPIAPGGLQRSATMPHIANLNFLDESNVEDAFEQLIMEQKQQKHSSSTTEKTETKEKDGAVVTTTTKVTTHTVTGSAAKPVSPFAKFKQLDKSNSQSAKSPTTPTAPGGVSTASPATGNQPIFKFTDPALNAKAATVKEQLLQWCQSKTQEYENIEITNFSTSWNNGLAFCALIHHFLPDAFDYSQLTPKNRRKNFELAFTVADEKAGIAPLLDVEDMVVMQRPDWKCVFVYVQSIYRRFRNCQ